MFMQKITAPACNLFDVQKGFYGNGNGGHISGDKPRDATDSEVRAYALFLARRASGLAELGEPELEFRTIGSGAAMHRYCLGATFGEVLTPGEYCRKTRQHIPAEYAPGAFSVLFPGANQMRRAVTFETLDDAGDVLTSSTMPVEPKKGGIVWGKDEVRKACGPVAKPAKAKRAPTVGKRTPTRINKRKAAIEPRRRALAKAWNLRAMLRDERAISDARLAEIDALRAELASARQNAEDCAAPVTPTHVAPMLSDAILSDLAAAERLMRGEGYVAPKPPKVRAPGHERAIMRAWSMRKARREAEAHLRIGAAQYEHLKAELQRVTALEDCTRRLASEMSEESAKRMRAVQDRARLAEQEAADALAMRDEMRGMLAALERRAEAAEAENAELWAEIEKLTAPATPVGAIAAEAGAA